MRPHLRLTLLAALAAAFALPGHAHALPPANTAPPTISGDAIDGRPLTADVGTWDNTPTSYAYQWEKCDAMAVCDFIPGADGAEYIVRSADIGYTIRVRVRASNDDGSADALSASTAAVVAGSPYVATAPSVATPAQVTPGTVVTADPGIWRGTGTITFAYQWYTCDPFQVLCEVLAGETDQSLVVPQVNRHLRVRVTATNAQGSTERDSNLTGLIVSSPPALLAAPAVYGLPYVGETLTVHPGVWVGTVPFTYSYAWERCDSVGANCAMVAGATAATFVLTSADENKRLRVHLTATNMVDGTGATTVFSSLVTTRPAAAGSGSTTSASVAPDLVATLATSALSTLVGSTLVYRVRIAPRAGTTAAPENTVLAFDVPSEVDVLSTSATRGPGCIAYGDTLVCDLKDLGSPKEAEVVVAVRVRIPGSLRASVSVTTTPGDASYANNRLVSVVTAREAGAARALVAAGPRVRGVARVGAKLVAQPGSRWNLPRPYRFEYRWQACRARCVDLARANRATLVVPRHAVGARLRVIVTAVNAAGGVFRISAATARVSR